jgi:hypothetical protein
VIRNTLALFALTAAMLVSAQELPGASITFDLGAYKTVSVDEMIQRLSKPGDKQRYFIAPVPVKFSATLMQMPKPGTFQLVYDSLNAWGVDPIPEVSHSSYLKVETGQVIPVYVEKQAADFVRANMVVQQQAEFYALHIYNYEQGPRFLVVSVSKGAK